MEGILREASGFQNAHAGICREIDDLVKIKKEHSRPTYYSWVHACTMCCVRSTTSYNFYSEWILSSFIIITNA